MEIDTVDNVCCGFSFPCMSSEDQMPTKQQGRSHVSPGEQPALKTNPRYFTHYRYGPQKRPTYQKNQIQDEGDQPKVQKIEKAMSVHGCMHLKASDGSKAGGQMDLAKAAHTLSKMLMHQKTMDASDTTEICSGEALSEKAEPLDLSTHGKGVNCEVTKTDENANFKLVSKGHSGKSESHWTTDENQNVLDLSTIANNINVLSGQDVKEQTETDSETMVVSPAPVIENGSPDSSFDSCLSDCSGDFDHIPDVDNSSDVIQYPECVKFFPHHRKNTSGARMRNACRSRNISLLTGTNKVGSTVVNVGLGSGGHVSVKTYGCSKNDGAEKADAVAPEGKALLSKTVEKEDTTFNKDMNVCSDQAQMVNMAQKETCSTKRVTDWAVGIFRRWMAEAPATAALPDLLKMTVPQINTYLCKFLVDARKTNGSRYPSKSLQALGQGLLRYVRNNRVYSHRECGAVGLFRPVNQVLSIELRRTLFYENLQGRMPRVRQRKGKVKKKDKERRVSGSPPNLKNSALLVDKDGAMEDNTTNPANGDSPRHYSIQAPHHTSFVSPQSESSPLGSVDSQESKTSKAKHDIPSSQERTETSPAILVSSPSESLPISSKSMSSGKDNDTQHTSVKGKSTLRNTRWAYQHFNRWRLAQGELGKALIPDIVDMSPREVNCYLADYITNVMKTDGTSYIPSCLYSLACGLLRHVRSQGRNDLDFMNSKDSRFADFQNALAARVKSLGQHEPKSRPRLPSLRLLTPAQEEKLWQYHVFGLETAKSLQYSVFYYNFKVFGIKSYMAHRNLRRHQFSVSRQHGENSVIFDTRSVGDKTSLDAGESCQVYREEPGTSPGSLVELYEVYLTAAGPTGPFYKRLLGLQGPTSRFSKQSVGIRALYMMWMDIWEAVTLE